MTRIQVDSVLLYIHTQIKNSDSVVNAVKIVVYMTRSEIKKITFLGENNVTPRQRKTIWLYSFQAGYFLFFSSSSFVLILMYNYLNLAKYEVNFFYE
jgi:hypothetical protein